MTIPRSRQATAVLVLLLTMSCKPAPPPPADGTAGGTPTPGDTVAAAPDTTRAPDTTVSDPANPPPNIHPRHMATLEDLQAEVNRLIGEARASDAGMCRTIAFGSKPCGGPRQYLVYSTSTTDSAALASAVARYNALEADINKKEGRMSDCMMVTPHRVTLVNGRCSVAPEGPAGK